MREQHTCSPIYYLKWKTIKQKRSSIAEYKQLFFNRMNLKKEGKKNLRNSPDVCRYHFKIGYLSETFGNNAFTESEIWGPVFFKKNFFGFYQVKSSEFPNTICYAYHTPPMFFGQYPISESDDRYIMIFFTLFE